MTEVLPPDPADIALAVAAFLDLEIPPACRDGVLANLRLLLSHAEKLRRLAETPS